MTDLPVISVSRANCTAVTGMSWDWVRRFARAHGVPVWRVARSHLIPWQPLAAAMAQAAAEQAPLTVADEVAALRAAAAPELRRLGRS